MNLIDSELNSPRELVVQAFRFLNREDKAAAFSSIYSEMIRTKMNADCFDDFILLDAKTTDSYIETVHCPNDNNHTVVKNGTDRNGRRRYKCKNCGITFFASMHSLSSSVVQDTAVWCRFVSGILQQESIETLAQACSISPTTAMNWQLRVFEAIRTIEADNKLSGVVVADDMRVYYNLKGNHSDDFIMPRKSRKRGHENTIKNSNKNQICVLCAIDDEGHSFSKIISFGVPNGKRTANGFRDKLNDDVDVLVTDGAKSFGETVRRYEIPYWERKPSHDYGRKKVPDISGNYNIQIINNYHSKLRKFLAKYNGVSSRRLPGYLLVFDFLQNHKGEGIDLLCCKILSAMAMPNKETTIEELNAKYSVPVSNGREKELWETKIPRKEQKVYLDWLNKIPIAEIMKNHHINKRKIYTIRDKVIRLNVHDKITELHKPKEESSNPENFYCQPKVIGKHLEIYHDYMNTEMTLQTVGEKYGISKQRVHQIVSKLKEADEHGNFYKKKRKSVKKSSPKPNYNKRNEQIFAMFNFLNSKDAHLHDIYKQVGRKFNLSERTVKNLIYKLRTEANSLDYTYHWSDERKNLSKDDYYIFLAKRDRAIYEEYLNSPEREVFGGLNKIAIRLSRKYNLSCSHCQLIIRTQRKLRQQEQVQEQELSNAS